MSKIDWPQVVKCLHGAALLLALVAILIVVVEMKDNQKRFYNMYGLEAEE